MNGPENESSKCDMAKESTRSGTNQRRFHKGAYRYHVISGECSLPIPISKQLHLYMCTSSAEITPYTFLICCPSVQRLSPLRRDIHLNFLINRPHYHSLSFSSETSNITKSCREFVTSSVQMGQCSSDVAGLFTLVFTQPSDAFAKRVHGPLSLL
jgi:hypothetical protein